MKKYLSISVLSLLLFSVMIYSCSGNSEDNIDLVDSQNKVIFEDLSLKTSISPNFYDNHFYLIEKLGNNNEKTEIINTVEKNGIDLSILDTKDVKKFYFNNSEILMYSVAVKNSLNKIIIYNYDDIYQVNIAEYSSVSDLKDFKLKSLDNQLFFSVQLDKENRIGNLTIEKNDNLNSFSNNVYTQHMDKHNLQTSNSRVNVVDCCRHASGWSACMDCTVEACGTSWFCVAALVVAGPETLAGFAVSCIGAGENTFC